MFQFQLAITNIVYNHGSPREPRWYIPFWKNFLGKNLKGGTKGKINLPPRFFSEISLNFMSLRKNCLLNPMSLPLTPPPNFENFKS